MAGFATAKTRRAVDVTRSETMNTEPPDYYAIYVVRSARARPSFLCNILAKGKAEALKGARKHGFKLPRWSFACRIGREGYFAKLKHEFR
jgi:hypothetical protein